MGGFTLIPVVIKRCLIEKKNQEIYTPLCNYLRIY